ncbi:hypothetical protein H8356DRAFT_1342317 [Neocallimastix lanati (nom. inval.)]|nr:hypothetical protein H8356DRAFT_1342317 [Neocallimastix sp. JGI-2020a]
MDDTYSFSYINISLQWHKKKISLGADSSEEKEEHVKGHPLRIIKDESDSDTKVNSLFELDKKYENNYVNAVFIPLIYKDFMEEVLLENQLFQQVLMFSWNKKEERRFHRVKDLTEKVLNPFSISLFPLLLLQFNLLISLKRTFSLSTDLIKQKKTYLSILPHYSQLRSLAEYILNQFDDSMMYDRDNSNIDRRKQTLTVDEEVSSFFFLKYPVEPECNIIGTLRFFVKAKRPYPQGGFENKTV